MSHIAQAVYTHLGISRHPWELFCSSGKWRKLVQLWHGCMHSMGFPGLEGPGVQEWEWAGGSWKAWNALPFWGYGPLKSVPAYRIYNLPSTCKPFTLSAHLVPSSRQVAAVQAAACAPESCNEWSHAHPINLNIPLWVTSAVHRWLRSRLNFLFLSLPVSPSQQAQMLPEPETLSEKHPRHGTPDEMLLSRLTSTTAASFPPIVVWDTHPGKLLITVLYSLFHFVGCCSYLQVLGWWKALTIFLWTRSI